MENGLGELSCDYQAMRQHFRRVGKTRGRVPTAAELIERDREYQEELAKKAQDATRKAYAFLMGVVEGVEMERVCVKGKGGPPRIVEVPISVADRVRACEAIKRLTVDKTYANKRDGAADKQGKGKGADLAAALREVEKRVRADMERKAQATGKLAKMKPPEVVGGTKSTAVGQE